MITTLCLIVCGSALADVLPAPPAPPPAVSLDQRVPARAPERVWANALGDLRHATVVNIEPVGGLLLAEDSRHGVTAFDPMTGTPRWFVQLPAALTYWPSEGDGLLAFACGSDVVIVDAASGSRVSTLDSASVAAGSPVADRHAAYVPSLLGDRVVTTDLGSGLIAWEYRMESPITAPALLIGSEAHRTVVVACADGTLRALPAGTNLPTHERWVVHVGQVIDRPVSSGGRVLVSSSDHVLYAFEEASGALLWKYLPGERLVSRPVPLGDLIAFSTPEHVVAVNAATGKLAWEQPAHSVAVADLDGRLLCQSRSGSEVRDAATGEVVASQLPPTAVAAGGLLIELRNGTELVGWRLAP